MKNLTEFRDAVTLALDGKVTVDTDGTSDETRAAVERIESLQYAVRQLLLAYAKADDVRAVPSGSIEWEDLNMAFDAAQDAMPEEYPRILAQLSENDAEEAEADAPPTYRIVRRYRMAPAPEVIQTGYTLEEAKRHCEDPSTHGVDWMDTWEQE